MTNLYKEDKEAFGDNNELGYVIASVVGFLVIGLITAVIAYLVYNIFI
jgi:hypothetical protein